MSAAPDQAPSANNVPAALIGSGDGFALSFPAHESVYVAAVTATKFMRNAFTNPHVGWGVFSRGKEWRRETHLRDAQAWAEKTFKGIVGWKEIRPKFRVALVANDKIRDAGERAAPPL